MSRQQQTAQLSERDRAILSGLAEAGFLSGRQIERRWFATEHVSEIGARRRTQRVLRRLTEAHLVQRLQRRQGGVRSGSDSFVYRLDHLGRRAVKLAGRGSGREPAERFLAHRLAVAEVETGLIEAQRDGQITDLTIRHEPDCWRRLMNRGGGLDTLKPDLLVELKTHNWELRWFVEVDRATEHLPTVLAKCQLYQRYWQTGLETERYGQAVFPRVLWSVPDSKRVEQITGAIQRARSLSDELFLVVTAEATTDVLAGVQLNTTNSKGGET